MDGNEDPAAVAEQGARFTESLQQISALRQQLVDHARLYSAAQGYLAEKDRDRLDAVERELEHIQGQKWKYTHHAQGESTELRLERAEATITALQRTCEEAAAAAAASGGSSFQSRLEERIKGLACLVEEGLSKSQGDIMQLKERLDGSVVEGEEEMSMEEWLQDLDSQITDMKRHIGGFVIDDGTPSDGEHCLENRIRRAEAQLTDMKEAAKTDALRWGHLEARVKQAEDEIGGVNHELYGDVSETEYDINKGNVVPRLDATEREVERLQEDHATAQQSAGQLAQELKNAQNDIERVWDLLTSSDHDGAQATSGATDRLAAAESEIQALKSQYRDFVGTDGEVDPISIVSKLEDTQRQVAELEETVHQETCAGQNLAERLDEAEGKLAALEQVDADDVMARLNEAEDKVDDALERLDNAEDNIAELQKMDPDEVFERLDAAEDNITELQRMDPDDVFERLDAAEDNIAELQKMDPDEVFERLDAAEDNITELQRMDPDDVLARLEEAADQIAGLQEIDADDMLARLEVAENQITGLQEVDADDMLIRLEEAEDEINKLTKVLSGVTDAARLPPDVEFILEAKAREWRELGVPVSQWDKLWAKKSKERPEAGPGDTLLEQTLQDIQSRLHSDLRGNYWGLDIKGFRAIDAAVDSKATEQVRDASSTTSHCI